jgi:hypothetical protein
MRRFAQTISIIYSLTALPARQPAGRAAPDRGERRLGTESTVLCELNTPLWYLRGRYVVETLKDTSVCDAVFFLF